MKITTPQSSEFPKGYKFKLIAYNIENQSELVLIDNHHAETERLFLQLAQEKFASVKEIFTHLEKAVKTGQKHIQPKNVSIANDLAVISRILSKTRLELFSVVLANCKVIKLKKTNQEIKPIALYDQIVISYPEKSNEHLEIEANYDKELEQLAAQKTFTNISQHHRRKETDPSELLKKIDLLGEELMKQDIRISIVTGLIEKHPYPTCCEAEKQRLGEVNKEIENRVN
ncbi:7652_t:CDS:2, partial [Ambispora leptoticha]